MLFIVATSRATQFKKRRRPFVVLVPDAWDDYGYKTTFSATLYLPSQDVVRLGDLKIMNVAQKPGRTLFPKSYFRKLAKGFASLGGGLDYYVTLRNLGEDIYDTYLRALRDVAYDDRIRSGVEDHEVYRVSLMRFSGAARTVLDASRMFSKSTQGPRPRNAGFIMRLKMKMAEHGEAFTSRFDFTRHGGLPNRINVVVGYNGTGKTTLLSNIAKIATGYGFSTKEEMLGAVAGRFVGKPPPFGSVIVVSYSAFDTFALPGASEIERGRLEEEGSLFGYTYCGLRELAGPAPNVSAKPDELYRLRTPRETQVEFIKALDRIIEAGRYNQFYAALQHLYREPSFLFGRAELFFRWDKQNLAEEFDALSSGHKIVLKIVTDLVAHMDMLQPTLVLIDELETHLHPSLMSALLGSVRACLNEFDAFAIIATHSPVLLQETPSRYVRILKRYGITTKLEVPTIETFGESIGIITQEVFNLDGGSAQWPRTLERLAKTRTLDEIEKIFKRKLGFAARSEIASIVSEQDDN